MMVMFGFLPSLLSYPCSLRCLKLPVFLVQPLSSGKSSVLRLGKSSPAPCPELLFDVRMPAKILTKIARPAVQHRADDFVREAGPASPSKTTASVTVQPRIVPP
jgi:hypothetical protein